MPSPAFFSQAGLFVLPNFLKSDVIQHLCTVMSSAPAERAKIARGRDVYLDEDFRSVDSISVESDIQDSLMEQLQGLIPALRTHFGMDLEGVETPVFLAYKPGDFFKAHVDGGEGPRTNDLRRRRVSAVIFLNPESREPAHGTYGEGKLKIYGVLDGPEWKKLAFPLDPEPGLLIAFPSDQFHEVTPVKHGRRFTVVTWFYGPDEPEVPEGAD